MASSKDKKDGNAFIGFMIFITVIGLIVFAVARSGLSDNTASNTSTENANKEEQVQKAQLRQTVIDRFAPKYCANKQATKVNLNESGVKEGWPGNDGAGWNDNECITIISKLYDDGATEQELQLVIDKKYAIGMREMSLLYSLGSPEKVNRSHYSGYITAQYVYGSTYIYSENGMVTSVQN